MENLKMVENVRKLMKSGKSWGKIVHIAKFTSGATPVFSSTMHACLLYC